MRIETYGVNQEETNIFKETDNVAKQTKYKHKQHKGKHQNRTYRSKIEICTAFYGFDPTTHDKFDEQYVINVIIVDKNTTLCSQKLH